MRFALLILAFMAVVFPRLTSSCHHPNSFCCGTGRVLTAYSQNGGGDEPRSYSANFSKRQSYETNSGHEHICPHFFLVPVYGHFFGEYITPEQIEAAVHHLTETFRTQGVTIIFIYQGSRRIDNEALADHADHLTMVERTRYGGFQTLNIYFVRNLRASNWGRSNKMRLHAMSTMPFDAGRQPLPEELMWEDMIVVDYRIATGELMPKAGLNALVHEAGHWLGLYHQFHGGCDPDSIGGGDYVLDTPPSARAVYDCPPRAVINCPPPLDDPVDTLNFMDNTPDVCKVHFTLGQKQRMTSTFCAYRFGTEFAENPPIAILPASWSDFPDRVGVDVYAQVHYGVMR